MSNETIRLDAEGLQITIAKLSTLVQGWILEVEKLLPSLEADSAGKDDVSQYAAGIMNRAAQDVHIECATLHRNAHLLSESLRKNIVRYCDADREL